MTQTANSRKVAFWRFGWDDENDQNEALRNAPWEPLSGLVWGPEKWFRKRSWEPPKTASGTGSQGVPWEASKPAFCEKQCFQRPTKRNRTRIRESRLLFRSLPVWSKTRFKVLGRFGRFPGPPKPPFPDPQKEGFQGGFGTLELAVPWGPGKWFRTANSSPPDRPSKPLIPEVGREGGNGRFG